MIPADLADAAAWLRNWTVEQALPLWSSAGFDTVHRRFEERLTLRGRPDKNVPIRLIVQARQIYSFALASRRGWSSAAAHLLEQAFATMIKEYHRPDGQDGWIFSINDDGSVADSKRDLYACAFVLLAVASYVQATGRRESLAVADETLTYIDRRMRAPKGGGYVESLPLAGELRRQNPHMHLFEALLALWAATADRRYLDRAEEIFELFSRRFFNPARGVLGEYFDDALRPAAGEAGETTEPGHHCEWVWLLRKFERESGREVQPFVDALFAHTETYGYDDNGLLVDELFSDGRVKAPAHRVWPMTEALKANVVEAARGRPRAASRLVALVNTLRERFLTTGTAGGWMDRLDKDGNPATEFMPASTLYHVICAVDELDRFAAAR